MDFHRSALISGAVALTSFFAIGTGAAADAAPSHASPATVNVTSAPKVATSFVIDLKEPTVHTTTASVNGKSETILVNAGGLPLYYFPGDDATKSVVSGGLLRLWPALDTASPTATGTNGKLASLKESSGRQVSYNGHFLYTFIDDTRGHVTGQGVSGFLVATPHLKAIGSAKKATTAPTSSSHGYGY